MSLLGILIPIVSKLALVTLGIIFFFFIIIVIGPGQNLSIIFFATFGTSSTKSLISLLATWTIKGLSWGLPFAINIFWTPFSSKALAPNPYTVSVGNATIPPDFITSAASFMYIKSFSKSLTMATFVSKLIPSFFTLKFVLLLFLYSEYIHQYM